VLDDSLASLQDITDRHPGISTLIATRRNIERIASFVDVLVGAVLVPGERTPTLVTREMVRSMKPRSVIIDIDIDEGGCVETARPTIHDNPTFIEEGAIHYCVPNIPGVVGRTATHAFVNAAMPFIIEVAQKGVREAIAQNPAIESAVNTLGGQMYHLSRLTVNKEIEDGLS
jgi:alanine dehydrogenase